MSKPTCTLCDLETPDPPVTSEETDGVFCCSGCLHVHQMLEDMEGDRAETLRRETIELRQKERQKVPLPAEYEEAFFSVSGMHCSTCESFVEALANQREGIYRSEASYASEMVKVYYNPDLITADELPTHLSKMGYTARPVDQQNNSIDLDETGRLVIGGFFGIIGLLLYVLFLYPSYISGEGFIPLTTPEKLFFVSNIFVMTTFVLVYTGFPILRGAWISISVGKPNMDLLITIAAVSAFLYSLGALLTGSAEVYFDVTMAIVLVVSIGNFYEKKIKSGRQNLLVNLLNKKQLTQARIQRNGTPQKVDLEKVKAGDRIIVKAGERIPIDGVVAEGKGVVNEALLTGESVPVSKKEGDSVLSGTLLTQNALVIRADENLHSTVDELLNLMWNIQATRRGKQRLADRIAAYFVPVVLFLGLGAFLFHLVNNASPTDAMLSALAVLIVSCPCALGLATPLAIASGIKSALNHSIIIKTAALFEGQSQTDIVAFDKTGTLTTGSMQLVDVSGHPDIRRYAAALEQYATHPIAAAITEANSNEDLPRVKNFRSDTQGISGIINENHVFAGKPEWLMNHGFKFLKQRHKVLVEKSRAKGLLPVAVGWDQKIRGILIVGDQLRAESRKIIADLKKEGKQIAIITGDSEEAGESIRQQLAPELLFTETRPESKSNIIKELRSAGHVAMIGDGSNDAPALAAADIGIAFGDLTAIAADSAQIVIPSDNLHHVPQAFRAIKQTRKRIRQNLGWAFLYNIITIPLAIAGAINPLFAAGAMATSSILVVSNSSRKMNLS